jgi:magnesium chelatase family protein
VLFLDEAAEFRRSSLDALRAPIEDRFVTVARARRTLVFPSSVMLVLALNPCPCGHLGDPRHACRCTPAQVRAYQQRLSGPLLDRIDLHVELLPVASEALVSAADNGGSSEVQARVVAARALQAARNRRQERCVCNADLDLAALDEVAPLAPAEARYLARAADALGISARAWHRVLRVARTIADLAGAERIDRAHLAEALALRRGLVAARAGVDQASAGV